MAIPLFKLIRLFDLTENFEYDIFISQYELCCIYLRYPCQLCVCIVDMNFNSILFCSFCNCYLRSQFSNLTTTAIIHSYITQSSISTPWSFQSHVKWISTTTNYFMLFFLNIYMIKIIRENTKSYSINAKFVFWIQILFFDVPVGFKLLLILLCQYMYDVKLGQSKMAQSRVEATVVQKVFMIIGIKLSEH